MHWTTLSEDERKVLWAEEDDAEMRALDQGIQRFNDSCSSQPLSKWPAARTLIATAVTEVTDEITRQADLAAAGRGMTGAKGWGHVFLYMDPKVMAVAGLCCILDNLSLRTEASLASVISRTGSAIETECHFTVLKREAPRLKAVMERRIKRWERRSLRRAMSALGEQVEYQWTPKVRRAVGKKVTEIIVEKSGVFTSFYRRSGNQTTRCLMLTDEAKEHILKMNEHLEIMTPIFQPMVVPPLPWGPEERGGYRLLQPYTSLTKASTGAPTPPDDHGPMVYEAVNQLQATPWRINPVVYETMRQVWQAGGGWAGLPHTEDILPSRPYPAEGTPDEIRDWKIMMSGVHCLNARAVGRRLCFLQCLDIATRYKDKVFYFPHQCDFRGRVYPVPQFLQPQGNDVARGLLTFADAKPLGERGLYWLRVQFANCHGVDKVSFGERVAWTNDVLHDLIQGPWKEPIPDPLEMKHLWAEADDPWQALATLMEILQAYDSGLPFTYPCSLPVSVDGSNSGLQHFSAMLRDPIGAELVNLSPGEAPSDIYADVAASVREAVSEDSRSGASTDTTIEDLPRQWLDQGIDRKLCKRGTMTFCYGVTPQGLKNSLREDGFVDWAKDQFAAVQYIGKKIWAGITANITGATEVMDWLRTCAVCANKADVLIEWRTPIGFHVSHPYNDPKMERVSCLSGEVYFSVYDPERGIRQGKQASSLPPNFVHSMDATHLMMTVSSGAATGLSHWMMIHDSFGTHACDVDHLNITLREEFVKLYEPDVLGSFRQQVIDQTGHDPGPPPPRGSFDLASIHDSPYFFG